MLPGSRAGGPGPFARALLLRAALGAIVWTVLSGGAPATWGIGLPALALAVALSLRLRPPGAPRFLVLGLPRFLAFFLFKSVKSGVQVAAMALRPRLDLRPAMLEIELRLPGETARIFLASTLNLLPGTLSCGLERQRLRLHVLDRRLPIERDVRQAEALVARLFGPAP